MFKVLNSNDPLLAGQDVRDHSAVLVEMDSDVTVKRVLGCDRGEPEDNSLYRDWDWIAPELNRERDIADNLRSRLTAAEGLLEAIYEGQPAACIGRPTDDGGCGQCIWCKVRAFLRGRK
jgi:hypothetical protein